MDEIDRIDYDDTLRQGTDKLNNSIDYSEQALITANRAIIDSAAAVATVEEKVIEIDVIKDEVIVLKDEVSDATDDLNELITVTDGVVQEVAQFTFIDAYSPSVAYSKNNTVSYNGSSYIAKQNTINNPPTDATYWGLLAQRGVDGEGSVSSVNGKFPDLSGNVEIEIPDPDLSGLATKQELQDVDDALTTHKADSVSHTTQVEKDSWNAKETPEEALKKVEQTDFKVFKIDKDSEGVFKTVEFKRNDGTLAIKSTLSGGESPLYTTRTIEYYGMDGLTVEKTTIRTLSYDEDDVLISEV